jgi:hypothetical protein
MWMRCPQDDNFFVSFNSTATMGRWRFVGAFLSEAGEAERLKLVALVLSAFRNWLGFFGNALTTDH